MTHGVAKITLDIETFGGLVKPTREDIKVPKNYTKPETIAKFIEVELPTAWGKQALNTLKGEMVCIGLAYEDEEVEVLARDTSEFQLMVDFNAWLLSKGVTEMTQVYWITHNGASFDLPWLLHRSWKYKFPLITSIIPKKKYDEHIVDLQILFPGTDNTMYKLDAIAKYFGMKGKGDMDGSMVHQAYIDGRLEEIVEYCKEDVDMTREIAKILKPEIW